MEWDVSLETGIPVVDEQHRSLFRQVNDLLDSTKADRVRETMSFLADYVVDHFGTEELLQKASKFPAAAGHKKLHDDFVASLKRLQAEYEAGDGGMLLLMKITKAALDWLEDHIRGADKAFADYCRASGIAADALADHGRRG